MQNLSCKLQLISFCVHKIAQSSLRSVWLPGSGRGLATAVPASSQSCNKCEPKPDHSWESNPECGKDPCEEAKRLDNVCPDENQCDRGPFNQTWNECPPRIIQEIPFCMGDKMPVATPRKGKPKTSPKQTGLTDKNERCPKMRLADCKEASKVVKCKRTRMPSDCVPVPAPCLSFSECEKDMPPWKIPSECNCYQLRCEPTDE